MAKKYDPLTAWLETVTAMNAAAATITIRMMRMQAAMLAGDPRGGREAESLVAEKTKAAAQGYMAAWQAAPFIWTAKSPRALFDVVSSVGMAAAAPGMKKAKANAKRLSRGPAKKRKTKKR